MNAKQAKKTIVKNAEVETGTPEVGEVAAVPVQTPSVVRVRALVRMLEGDMRECGAVWETTAERAAALGGLVTLVQEVGDFNA